MPEHVPDRPRLDRRTLLRLGGAAMVAPAVAACTRAPDPGAQSGGDGKFTFYTSANHVYDTWKDVVSAFEKDHGVTVNWQKFQWPDMQTKLQADLSAGIVPDLVEQPGGFAVVNFAVDGEALSLDPYIEKDGKKIGYPDDWQDAAAEAWVYEDSTYGVQLQLTCLQPYYNKALLDKAGIGEPPTSWDDFLAAAKELTTDKTHGFAANQAPFYSWGWMLQNGVTYYDAAKDDFLTPHDAAAEAMQFQADLVHKHKVSPVPNPSSDPSGPRNLLVAKRAAIIETGPWDIEPIQEGDPDLDLGIAQPRKGKVQATALAGSGVFIPKNSERADLAWDLVKRLTDLETELKLTKEAGQTMARKSWANSKEVTSNPFHQPVAKALGIARDWYGELAATGKVNQVDAAYKAFYQSVVIRNEPAEKELQTFLTAARKALSR